MALWEGLWCTCTRVVLVARGMLYVKKPRRARSSPAHVAHALARFVKHNICRVAQLVAPIHTRSVAAGASTSKTHEGGISLVFPSVAAASSATTRMSPSSKWSLKDSSADQSSTSSGSDSGGCGSIERARAKSTTASVSTRARCASGSRARATAPRFG